MGRKTFVSIGKPLPNRRNIIITRNPGWHTPGCEVVHSLTAAVLAAGDTDEIMIIGGASIYRESLPRATRLYLTLIHYSFTGDTFFPQWDPREWREISRADFAADANNPYPFSFLVLERRQGTLNN